ncbi:hypothetical protein E2C01_020409 [Portunus trituberculatus]|uniref:Uncharacterized protein n=1 Tax=Portunus trituberculatus TaxID=210409 RepID=A0A5B7DZP2_PORTR|nr:hypothetical protein [Portunus trituberculatus]
MLAFSPQLTPSARARTALSSRATTPNASAMGLPESPNYYYYYYYYSLSPARSLPSLHQVKGEEPRSLTVEVTLSVSCQYRVIFTHVIPINGVPLFARVVAVLTDGNSLVVVGSLICVVVI